MVDTCQFFFRYGHNIVSLFYNVHYHLIVKKQDFPFVICGYPGVGKSDMGLHLFEVWNRVILKRKIVDEDIKYIKGNKIDWLKNFKILNVADMTINDEAADGLNSKESIKRFGRDIQKLYNVNRKKRIFTVLIIPDFFDLPLYFRKRVRGCLFIDRMGHYKFYSKQGITYLNAFNQNKKVKNMNLAYPMFSGVYPKYEGILREVYDDQAEVAADRILDEIIKDNTIVDKESLMELKGRKIVELRKNKMKWDDVCKELDIGTRMTAIKYYKLALAKLG